jgi:succinate dehydrogenase / fumarate reductase membrane anchor subunit
MATEAPPKPVHTEPRVKTRWSKTGARPRPVNTFELYSWYFFRVSGILLLVLALGHLLIMHILNNVDVINYQFISDRWASPLWRTYDIMLLVLALAHGFNGVRVLIYDYVSSRNWRVFALSTLYVFGLFFMLIGIQVIITFQPQINVVATGK